MTPPIEIAAPQTWQGLELHAGIDDAVWSIEPLLEWADRDERDHGLGDAPYPPNFPKQEGEPMRVQPSRAKRVEPAAE